MISTDFAPNESWDDAWLSLKIIFQPWRWLDGNEIIQAKNKILESLNVSCLIFHVSFFLTGRAALYHLLKSLNLPSGSEVLIQAFTCEAVVLPVLANNLKPVYIDIEAKTFSMNPIDLGNKITGKSRVLILQHTFGLTPDHRNEIVKLVRKHNLVLIEDIAHTIKSMASKQSKTSDFYLLSFGRTKALSSVFGGAIVTSDNKIANRLLKEEENLKFPSYGFILRLLLYKPVSMIIKSTYDLIIGKIIHKIINIFHLIVPEITGNEKRGEFDQILNKAYPNALAVLLLHQLSKYDRICEVRAQATRIYAKSFKNQKIKINMLFPLRYPLLLNKRDSLLKSAAKNNIFLGKWYDQVVAPKDLNVSKLNYKKGSCPVAEEICEKIINLLTTISENDVNRIIKFIKIHGH